MERKPVPLASAVTPAAVPRRLTVPLLFGGPECKIGVADCWCVHVEFPGFHQLRHSNDNI